MGGLQSLSGHLGEETEALNTKRIGSDKTEGTTFVQDRNQEMSLLKTLLQMQTYKSKNL